MNWIFVAIEGVLAIRLVLMALGANASAGFAQLIYGISAPLVGPFVGLFNNVRYQGGVLDMSAVVALIVYAVIAWLVVKLVWIVVGETRSAVRTRTSRRTV